MDAEEFLCWMAYSHLEPFTFDADDIRMGSLLSTYINAHRDPQKGDAVSPFDLLPWRARSQRKPAKALYEMSDEDQLAHWRAVVGAR